MTTEFTHQPDADEPATGTGDADAATQWTRRSMRSAIGRHGRIARAFALVAVAAFIGAAYVVGGPPIFDGGGATYAAVPSAGAAFDGSTTGRFSAEYGQNGSKTSGGAPVAEAAVPQAIDQKPWSANVNETKIIKTGTMTLEVAEIDTALSQAKSVIAGMGGRVDSSNRYGTGPDMVATVTFRVPADKWDQALSEIHKVGSKIISEQTGTADVTGQVADLAAQIKNLQTTETALQSIMARASAIPDVVAVQNQLTTVQGQIEQLQAQSKTVNDQADMSTLAVTFQLPTKTVITAATQDWTLSSQVDQAGAALVRIGQGLATIGVWILVVVLPLALVLGLLLGLAAIFRRIRNRGRSRTEVAA